MLKNQTKYYCNELVRGCIYVNYEIKVSFPRRCQLDRIDKHLNWIVQLSIIKPPDTASRIDVHITIRVQQKHVRWYVLVHHSVEKLPHISLIVLNLNGIRFERFEIEMLELFQVNCSPTHSGSKGERHLSNFFLTRSLQVFFC